MQKNVFIIGSKGIPARYGGFETFVEKLAKYWRRNDVKFHIACPKINYESDYEYNNSRCFIINISKLGSYRSIIYDLISLKESLNYINRNISCWQIRFKKKFRKSNQSFFGSNL